MGQWLTRSGAIEPCVYRPGQPSRYEVLIPTEQLQPAEVDTLHAKGARRSGWLFYRPACPTCQACLPLRVPVATFRPSRSQKRAWSRNQDLDVQVGPPRVTAERVALYNKHLFGRNLNTSDTPITLEQYGEWLVQSGIETLEFSYEVQGELIGIGLVDMGALDGSSVYFYFDPSQGKRSLGTFSVLKELEWLAQRNARFHYLGFYNRDCRPLRYKAAFGPHELLVQADTAPEWAYRPPNAPYY